MRAAWPHDRCQCSAWAVAYSMYELHSSCADYTVRRSSTAGGVRRGPSIPSAYSSAGRVGAPPGGLLVSDTGAKRSQPSLAMRACRSFSRLSLIICSRSMSLRTCSGSGSPSACLRLSVQPSGVDCEPSKRERPRHKREENLVGGRGVRGADLTWGVLQLGRPAEARPLHSNKTHFQRVFPSLQA